MSLRPINDNVKIEVAHDEYGFGDQNAGTENGIIVAVPVELNYLGMHSFAFEGSFMETEKLSEILEYYKSLVGKRAYWSAFKERGSVLKEGGKTYAFLKLTDLIAISDSDEEAEVVADTRSGSFSV